MNHDRKSPGIHGIRLKGDRFAFARVLAFREIEVPPSRLAYMENQTQPVERRNISVSHELPTPLARACTLRTACSRFGTHCTRIDEKEREKVARGKRKKRQRRTANPGSRSNELLIRDNWKSFRVEPSVSYGILIPGKEKKERRLTKLRPRNACLIRASSRVDFSFGLPSPLSLSLARTAARGCRGSSPTANSQDFPCVFAALVLRTHSPARTRYAGTGFNLRDAT